MAQPGSALRSGRRGREFKSPCPDSELVAVTVMVIVRSHNGVPVRLTEERWRHIIRRHPEMDSLREKVLETVSEPEIIQQGDFGELLTIRFYPLTPLTGKNVVVVYREISSEDGFVLTAYLANRPSARRLIIWKR